MSNFCSQCGNKIVPNSSFCNACGASLDDDASYDGAYGGSANPYEAGAPFADEASYYAADADATVGPSFWGSFGYGLKNYCNFRGRATRTEYWGWGIVNALICTGLQVGAVALTAGGGADPEAASDVVDTLWSLAVALPALAVMARRLHDVGWSAKLMLGPIALGIVGLPLLIMGVGLENLETDDAVVASMGTALVGLALIGVAGIWQLVLGITAGFVRGTQGPNRFGGARLNPSDAQR